MLHGQWERVVKTKNVNKNLLVYQTNLRGFFMEKEVSSIKSVDEMGRVTLPLELRKMLNIREGGKVEIGVCDNKFIISKYNPMTKLKEWADCVVNSISQVVEHEIVFTDDEKVLSSNKKKYLKKQLTPEVQEVFYRREMVIKKKDEDSTMLPIFLDTEQDFCCELIVPIVKNNDLIGSIIVLATENKCFDNDVVKVCKGFSYFLSCLIEI